MTYSTSTMVKSRTGVSGSGRDSDITAAITFADAYCDAAISAARGSIPVASPPQMLKEASADLAAYYVLRIDNPTTATLFYESGKTLLSNYIKKEYKAGGVGRTGKRGVRDDDE